MCPVAGCGTSNEPDKEKCVKCEKKWNATCICGACNKVTAIPETNLMNSIRSTKLSTQQSVENAKKIASFTSEHKEEIKAVGSFVAENPALFSKD